MEKPVDQFKDFGFVLADVLSEGLVVEAFQI
jgi:hypothetical protein